MQNALLCSQMDKFGYQAKQKEPVDYSHPVDQIEPISDHNAYREASLKMKSVINHTFSFILSSNPRCVTAWQVAFAIGSAHCEGRTMGDVAKTCGVTRAMISKGARNFCKMTGLPPSFYMKKEETSDTYSRSRFKSILKNNPNSI